MSEGTNDDLNNLGNEQENEDEENNEQEEKSHN